MPCGRSRGGKAPANAQFSPVWQKEDFQPRITRITRMGAQHTVFRPYGDIARPSA